LTQSGDNNQSSNTRNNNQNKGKNSEMGQQRHDKVDTLQYAQSNRMNKNKRPTTIVSFEKSDGCDGCALHVKATDHMTAECHVIRKQIDNMQAQWNAQLQNTFKKQKTNNQPKKQGGNLHAMLDDVKKVKAHLKKEIKQTHMASGKHKTTVSFVSDLIQEREETKANDRNSDSFQSELEQLTLSDVNDNELDDLDLSEIE
jgi:septal ring factor EnvC (AmiA/AmiB activator)